MNIYYAKKYLSSLSNPQNGILEQVDQDEINALPLGIVPVKTRMDNELPRVPWPPACCHKKTWFSDFRSTAASSSCCSGASNANFSLLYFAPNNKSVTDGWP